MNLKQAKELQERTNERHIEEVTDFAVCTPTAARIANSVIQSIKIYHDKLDYVIDIYTDVHFNITRERFLTSVDITNGEGYSIRITGMALNSFIAMSLFRNQ